MTRESGEEDDAEEVIRELVGFAADPRAAELTDNFVAMRAGVLELRHYFDVLLDAAVTAEAEPAEAVAERSFVARLLTSKDRERIRGVAQEQLAEMNRATEELGSQAERVAVELDPAAIAADPFGAAAQIGDMHGMAELMARVIRQNMQLSVAEHAYWSTYIQARTWGADRQLLLRSQFIVAMTLVQPALAHLIALLGRLEADRAKLPVSLDAIDAEIRALLQRGPEQWKTSLIDRFGLTALEEAVDWLALERFWIIRNLLVHRGGWVDDSRTPDIERRRSAEIPALTLGFAP